MPLANRRQKTLDNQKKKMQYKNNGGTMKSILRGLIHAAIGGCAAGLATIPAASPITTKTILYPALASAITSVIAWLAQSPLER
jgi:hypothetical protein